MTVRWKIYASAKKWDGAFAIAETLADQLPGYERGWLYLAATLHGMGKTEDAYETLVNVAEEFAQYRLLHLPVVAKNHHLSNSLALLNEQGICSWGYLYQLTS